MEHEQQYVTVTKYERKFADLLNGTAIYTKASTIETSSDEGTAIRGEVDTFIVQTFRRDKGDYISLKIIDGSGTYRVVLPPKVTAVMAAQRESLTARRRSAASKAAAKKRMDAGILPGFMRKKKGKKTHGDRVK